MPTVIHGPRYNRRVTCDTNPENARSESDIAVNPRDPYNMVGASKRFTDLASYAFSLAAYATFDGGQTWTETVLPLTDTDGRTYPSTTDPAVIFDDQGNVYVVALPWQGETGPNSGQTIGISVYRSSDGGASCSAPVVVASGITNLYGGLPMPYGWPVFPGASFRVITYGADTTSGSHLVVVWADVREGVSRIYYRHSPNLGASWDGPASGQPLLTGALASAADMQDFHPQVATTPIGEIGCTFYEYGPTGGGEFPAT